MSYRKIKNKKFHINKIKKRMRQLVRRNRRRRHTVGKNSDINETSLHVYNFLKNQQFDEVKFEERMNAKLSKGAISIEIPEIFSITKNPEETIKILKKVFYYCCNRTINLIQFNHKKCKELEIAASTIMDTIVMSAKAYRRLSGEEIIISGNFPDDMKARKIFIASGLPSHLEINVKTKIRKDNIKLFKLVAGRSGTKRSGTIATRLTDYFNSCLNTQSYELTPMGKNNFSKMFGEVIDNCENHGGKDAMWYTLGHFNIIEDYGEVNLVFFNYGNTIYEQLISNETSMETLEKIKFMKKKHESIYDDNWNEETMLTVFSLQQGISRLRNKNSEGNKKRGTGTIILLDTFYKIGKSTHDMEPEFSITSGHTHIIFDQKYKLKEELLEEEIFGKCKRKIIAFNDTNNIFEKADTSNVKCMKEFFPGTIISMKFFIDNEYLKSLKEVK